MPPQNTALPACLQCGKTVKRKGKVYCSHACYHARRRDSFASRKARVCPRCAVAFVATFPSQRYCSRRCGVPALSGAATGRWKGGPVERDCEQCGARFTATRDSIQRGKGRFCSIVCHAKHKQDRATVRSSARYREWRLAVLSRDNFTCCHCGCADIRPRWLCGHHRLGWRERPDLRFDVDNGVTLCNPCHTRLHAALRGESVSDDIWASDCTDSNQKPLECTALAETPTALEHTG